MAGLSQSIDAVVSAIVGAVGAAIAVPGSGLEDVATVVRGDHARPQPAMPAVWVVPGLATCTQATYDAEAWDLSVTLAALVRADDPERGGADAQRIAASARAVALGLAPGGIAGAEVTDVTSATFDPTARSSEQNRTLHWTDATIRVAFTTDRR